MRKGSSSLLVLASAIPLVSSAAPILNSDKYLEGVFSTALILTDSEMLSFGFANFDPNEIFGTDNPNFGGQEAVDARKKIRGTSLPISFLFENDENNWLHRLKLRAAYMELSRDINYQALDELNLDWESDKTTDQVWSGYAEYALGYQVSEGWQFFVGSGLHLMHYRNRFTANSPLKGLIEENNIDSVINGSSNIWIAEPQADLIYTKDMGPGEIKFNTEYHYFWGRSYGGSIDTSSATPEGWRFMNSLQYKYHLKPWGDRKQDFLVRFRRIDVGGDLRDPVGATHYNEYAFGWVVDTSDYSSVIYNVGIGININYGSSLKGGSLVFFYNE